MRVRTTATVPDDLTDLMEGAVKAGVFENKSDAIRHGLREHFEENQNARIAPTSTALMPIGAVWTTSFPRDRAKCGKSP